VGFVLSIAYLSAWKLWIAVNVANATVITVVGSWTLPAVTEQGLVGLITALLVTWNTYRQSKQGKQVTAIHTLTNSAMGAQLKINVDFAQQNAVLAHRLAAISKDEGDVAAANAADVIVTSQKAIYQEHLIRQAKVDAVADN
jgi:hypothetical protein